MIVENGKQPDSLHPGLLARSSAKPLIIGNIFAGNGAEAIWLREADETILQRNSFSLASPSTDSAGARSNIRILPPAEGHP